MSDQAQADSHSDSLCSSQVRGGRHLLVLSSAGKPIFSLQHGDETSVADLAALVAAIVSFVQRGGDEIRHVRAGATSLAFLVRGPLYLVASSSCGDTVPYLSRQLAALHAQLLSVLTSKVEEVFARNAGFDLRSLLGGTDRALQRMLRGATSSPSLLLQAPPAMRAPPALRGELTRRLRRNRPAPLLFAVLLGHGRLLTALRGQRAALGASDLLLLLNAISEAAEGGEGGGEGRGGEGGGGEGRGGRQFADDQSQSWLPLCLPHFNERGFLHAHVSTVGQHLRLVLLSPDRDAFAPLAAHRDAFAASLAALAPPAASALAAALAAPSPPLEAAGVPELLHYAYTATSLGQSTSPLLPAGSPYAEPAALERLLRRYQRAQARTHAKGRDGPAHEYFAASDSELVVAWRGAGFELYVALWPLIQLPAAAAACSQLLRWLRREEKALFLTYTKY